MDTQRKNRILEKLAMEDYTVRQGAGWMEAAKGMGAGDWRAMQKQFGTLRAGDQFRQNDGGQYERVRAGQQFGAYKPGAAAAPAAVAAAPAMPAPPAPAQRVQLARDPGTPWRPPVAQPSPQPSPGAADNSSILGASERAALQRLSGTAGLGGRPLRIQPGQAAVTVPAAPGVVRPATAAGGI